jgi:predicted tellurium resistance membrane protein TerC
MSSWLAALSHAEGWASLLTLTVLEIVLGIDNIVFIAIVSQRVQAAQRSRLRRVGLTLALGLRIALLMSLSWLMGLTRPLITAFGRELSGRDLVLFVGGLFLIWKSTSELFERAEQHQGEGGPKKPQGRFGALLVQILLLDIVFSLDSVITAVGMARDISIMITAMIIAVITMVIFANAISEFIGRHPSMKVLALAFLLMIGFLLVADAFGHSVPKGYVYFAMAFSFGVELLNIRRRRQEAKARKSRVEALTGSSAAREPSHAVEAVAQTLAAENEAKEKAGSPGDDGSG